MGQMNDDFSDNDGIDEVVRGIASIADGDRKDESSLLKDSPGPRVRNLSTSEEAYASWLKDRSSSNMSKVLDSLSPTINSEIMRYSGPKTLLRSRAKVLAIKAVKSFNPMSGARLNSWVVTNLQPLSRYSIKQRDVQVPEVAARQAASVARATEELRDELGRDPTDEEIADELHISSKRVAKVREMAKASVTAGSFEQEQQEQTGQPGVDTPSGIPFAQEAVYQGLSDNDKFIFDSLTGMHGGSQMPANRVASTLGVSPAAVSQRASEIARQIAYVAENG